MENKVEEIKIDFDFGKLKDLVPEGIILFGFRGSIAHGMFVPNTDLNSIDDIDLMGIFIAPVEHYLGFGRKDYYGKFVGQYDVVNYELRKFISLLLKSNPNVMSMLWLPDNCMKYTTDIGNMLIENRDIFVSKQAYNSYSGYAFSQFKKMTHLAYKGYMGTKRKQLVDKYGYDVKNATHLIRLLRMGIEFLNEGKLNVDRSKIDAEELLQIKRGEWSLGRVEKLADYYFPKLEEAYKNSSLPEKPNKDKAEKLLMHMLNKYYKKLF